MKRESALSPIRCLTGRFIVVVLAMAFIGHASASPPETAYNQGVDAYKTKNYSSAREHWSSAVASGNPAAENNLGYLLYYGLGGDPDRESAVALWRKAAYAGHSEAQWHLGVAFEEGKAVPQNFVEAFAWYRCAVASAARRADDRREVEEEIADDARKSLEKLLDKLTKEQFESGKALARQYMEKYASRNGT